MFDNNTLITNYISNISIKNYASKSCSNFIFFGIPLNNVFIWGVKNVTRHIQMYYTYTPDHGP